MLLSTVLEKVVMVLVVVVVGTGCSYTSERHTCQRHFLYMASVSLSLSLSLSRPSLFLSLLPRRLFSHVLFRLGHIRRENNALQSQDARLLAGSCEFIQCLLVKRAKK